MRSLTKPQTNPFFQWPEHKFGHELKKISEILDRHPEFSFMAHEDLTFGLIDTGSDGMSSEQVLRAGILKCINGLSYEKLAFNIIDSKSSRAFLMLDENEKYSSSTLQNTLSKISEKTWEEISKTLVLDAKGQGIENCKKARVDSTVTDSNIDYPTDSFLLYDCIRVINRSFQRVREMLGKKSWRFSTKKDVEMAKSLRYKINNAKNEEERLPHYKELLKIAQRLEKELPSLIAKIEKTKSKIKERHNFDIRFL